MNIQAKKGFTLIEILIVVAIIGILASIVLVGLGPSQRGARDARRISDMKQIQNGLELYFHKCGYYPGDAQPTSPCGAFVAGSNFAAMTTALTGSAIGVNQVPADPVKGRATGYEYASSPDGTGYILKAVLENPSSALDGDVDGTVFLIDCTDDPVPNYCVQL